MCCLKTKANYSVKLVKCGEITLLYFCIHKITKAYIKENCSPYSTRQGNEEHVFSKLSAVCTGCSF